MTKFLAVASIAFAAFAFASTPADAQYHEREWRGGWVQCTAANFRGQRWSGNPERRRSMAADNAVRTCQYWSGGAPCRIVHCTR